MDGEGRASKITTYKGEAMRVARSLYTLILHTIFLPGTPVLSMREAVFIVSPNTLNLGSLVPMRPVTTGPVCMPTRTRVGLPSWGMRTVLAQRRMA